MAQVYVDDVGHPEPGPDDAHHLTRVLRLRAGEVVVAADGQGGWRPCRFTASGGQLLEPDGEVVRCPPPEPPLTVGFAPVKGDRPEWAVQKLTEAGVDRIVVLRTERTVVRWEGERARRQLARLRRVAREAGAQSRRAVLPEVHGVTGLGEVEALLAPTPLALAQRGGVPPSLAWPAVAVGPEGGWDPAELAGRPVVGLGRGVLRTETAAVAAGILLCALRDGSVRAAVPPPPGTSS